MNMMKTQIDPNAERKAWVSLLAKSPAADRTPVGPALWTPTPITVFCAAARDWRRDGARAGQEPWGRVFNLAKCPSPAPRVKLGCAPLGHGYVQGAAKDHGALRGPH